MSKFNIDFRLGTEPDIAITDGDGIKLVTAGIVSHLRLLADADGGRIVHIQGETETVLAAGKVNELVPLFDRLTSDLLRPRRGTHLPTAVMTSIVAVGVMLGLFALVDRDRDREMASALRSFTPPAVTPLQSLPVTGQSVPVPQLTPSAPPQPIPLLPVPVPEKSFTAPAPSAMQPAVPPQANRAPSFEDIVRSFKNTRTDETAGGAATPFSARQANAMAKGLSELKDGTQILPRPDFLKLADEDETPPEAAPTDVAPAAPTESKEPAATAGNATEAKAPKDQSFDLDAVTSALDQAGRDAAAAVRSSPAAPAVSKPQSETPKASEAPITPAAKAPTEAKPIEATPKTAPVAEVKGATTPAKDGDPAVVDKKALSKSVDKLVQGLTKEQAAGIVKQLDKLDGGEITEDMLANLPHEVAAMLKEAGLVTATADEENAPGGTPYRIIRLPESVMEKHRGKDGIANIPGRNTWSATGNFVRLPLPGGGDIKDPETMRRSFGLIP